MGLHHLRLPVRSGTADLLNGLHDRGRRASGAQRAFCQRPAEAPPSRFGKTASRFCDALGLFRFLAAPDHLVRQSARRNQLLPHPAVRWLGRRRRDRSGVPFLRTFFSAPFAGREAQLQSAPQDRYVAHLHAPCGFILDDAPGIYFSRHAYVARHCFAPRPRRIVAPLLCLLIEAMPASSAWRPRICGGPRALLALGPTTLAKKLPTPTSPS